MFVMVVYRRGMTVKFCEYGECVSFEHFFLITFSNFLVALSSICLFIILSPLLGLESAVSSTEQILCNLTLLTNR